MTRTLVLVPLLALSGCKGINLGNLPSLEELLPKVRFERMEVTGIDFEHVAVDFVLGIDNPNPIGLELASLGWALALDGEPFLDGKGTDRLAIAARGSSSIAIPLSVTYAALPGAIQALTGADGAPYALSTKLGFSTPLGEVSVPLRHEGTLPVLRAPQLSFQAVRLDGVDLLRQSATLAIDLGLTHDQASMLKFTGFDYAFSLSGKALVEGKVAKLAEVPAGKVQTVTLPITVNLLQVGTSIAQAITTGGQVQVGLDATVTVGTPFGDVPLAIDETGKLRVER
ncbi:MAG: LEA type 2 family protein [Alphaproteobacteria bacterium]|nr:LEA type 2 family protein [Alphaproteobacteria bacterium]